MEHFEETVERTTHISVTNFFPLALHFPQLFTKTRELLRPAGLDD